MRRLAWAVILNAFVPGTGLIVLRREWLGLAVALLFGVISQLGIWGRWIIPANVPPLVAGSALWSAGLIWVGSQFMVYRCWRFITSPDVQEEFERLLLESDEAWTQGDWVRVRQILIVARTIDDEHVGVNLRWARLMEKLGDKSRAHAAWKRVLRLQPDNADQQEAQRGLAAPSSQP